MTLPLKVKAVLHATTDKAETLARSVIMSSLIPSLKYSCSGSPLLLANGSTQMESFGTAARGVSDRRTSGQTLVAGGAKISR